MNILKSIIQKTISLLNKLEFSFKENNSKDIPLNKPISNKELEVMATDISSYIEEESISKTTLTTVTFSLGEQVQYDLDEVKGLTIQNLIEKASESLYFKDSIVNIKENGVLVWNKSQPVKIGANYILYTKIATKA